MEINHIITHTDTDSDTYSGHWIIDFNDQEEAEKAKEILEKLIIKANPAWTKQIQQIIRAQQGGKTKSA